jgi:hypothetical protein
MIQTRAGVCPNCKDETPSGAEQCPSCGFHLEWGKSNDEQRARRYESSSSKSTSATTASRPKSKAPAALRLFILFVVACVAIMAAVTIRSRAKNAVAPETVAEHATLVQDAEAFRDQIRSDQTNSESPETNYVIGIALPNGSDVLEITVRNDWKTLDYPTRLNYAAKFVERWKALQTPHRANMTLLDESGNEIGGRTWNGTVWVQEKHDDAPQPAKPAAPVNPDSANNSTANSTANQTANTTANAVVPGESTPNSASSTANSTSSATSNSTDSEDPTVNHDLATPGPAGSTNSTGGQSTLPPVTAPNSTENRT